MNFDDNLLLDVRILVSNTCVYSTKHFMEDVEESFADSITAVLTEYATSTSTVDDVLVSEGGDDDDDPVLVWLYFMCYKS